MGQVHITLPIMGEGITDATITKYLVAQGDNVSADTPLVEVATDKVDSEIPSPCSGVVISLTHNEGDVVPVGETLLIIDSPESEESSEKRTSVINEISTFAIPKELIEKEASTKSNNHKRLLSPLVKQLIKEHQIKEDDIERISGTGLSGKITKEDVLLFVNNNYNNLPHTSSEIPIAAFIPEKPVHQPAASPEPSYSSAEVEMVEMDRMRKLIAEHMVHSVQTAPHVTSFIEVDVTRLVEWRNKVKDEFQKKHSEKLTFMPVFIESTVMAIKDFPLINVSVEGSKILIKKNIHIGIATALPTGNLIVPVIKNTDQKNLIGLAKSLNDLSMRARESKLFPDEIKGGTFTITNLGSFGTLSGTPIINQPEAAILAIGEIRKMPAVIETPAGDAIAIRNKAILSLTFDHRVIDGALAGSFLKKVSEYLQNFDVFRKF